jgi:hypothetical protein
MLPGSSPGYETTAKHKALILHKALVLHACPQETQIPAVTHEYIPVGTCGGHSAAHCTDTVLQQTQGNLFGTETVREVSDFSICALHACIGQAHQSLIADSWT